MISYSISLIKRQKKTSCSEDLRGKSFTQNLHNLKILEKEQHRIKHLPKQLPNKNDFSLENDIKC